MEECTAPHTSFDPRIEDFNCPRCGAKCGNIFDGDFGVDKNAGLDHCFKLHLRDLIICDVCGWKGDGETWVELYQQLHAKLSTDDNETGLWEVTGFVRKVGEFVITVEADGGSAHSYLWQITFNEKVLKSGAGMTAESAKDGANRFLCVLIERAARDLGMKL